jgi:hypothetical protein
MLANEDLAVMYRKKEFGMTHTLNIDECKLTSNKFLGKYEGVIPDVKKE